MSRLLLIEDQEGDAEEVCPYRTEGFYEKLVSYIQDLPDEEQGRLLARLLMERGIRLGKLQVSSPMDPFPHLRIDFQDGRQVWYDCQGTVYQGMEAGVPSHLVHGTSLIEVRFWRRKEDLVASSSLMLPGVSSEEAVKLLEKEVPLSMGSLDAGLKTLLADIRKTSEDKPMVPGSESRAPIPHEEE